MQISHFFRSSHFSKFKAGDPESFYLLMELIRDEKIQSNKKLKEIWSIVLNFPKLFLTLDHRYISTEIVGAKNFTPQILVEIAIQKRSSKLYNYGEKGALLTTSLISSITSAIEGYFEETRNTSKTLAFLRFKQLAIDGFNFRKLLVRYNTTENWEKNPHLTRFIRDIEKFPNRDKIIKYGLGLFVLKMRLNCGNKSKGRDDQYCVQIQNLLKKSESMEEFLGVFLNTNKAQNKAA
jgi:hypothetical protein